VDPEASIGDHRSIEAGPAPVGSLEPRPPKHAGRAPFLPPPPRTPAEPPPFRLPPSHRIGPPPPGTSWGITPPGPPAFARPPRGGPGGKPSRPGRPARSLFREEWIPPRNFVAVEWIWQGRTDCGAALFEREPVCSNRDEIEGRPSIPPSKSDTPAHPPPPPGRVPQERAGLATAGGPLWPDPPGGARAGRPAAPGGPPAHFLGRKGVPLAISSQWNGFGGG
jgi:hypothetical protein